MLGLLDRSGSRYGGVLNNPDPGAPLENLIGNRSGAQYAHGHPAIGVGGLGMRGPSSPRIESGRAMIRGSLSPDIIRRIIRRHINEVKYCYVNELQANHLLRGKVVVEFTIAATGRVFASGGRRSTLGHPKVEQCIVHATRRWLFPTPLGGGSVRVVYPFLFRAPGSGA